MLDEPRVHHLMQKSGRQFQFVLSKDMAEGNAKSKPVWQGFRWQVMGSSLCFKTTLAALQRRVWRATIVNEGSYERTHQSS